MGMIVELRKAEFIREAGRQGRGSGAQGQGPVFKGVYRAAAHTEQVGDALDGDLQNG